ncbi:MAG: hypothetical protein D6738_14670 [Acidobacteria bacterium]|nr:MAG: hypothetical protein D6738_14670 [Acidobacteriota bacterium]
MAFVVAWDFPSIHRWVFGTDRAVEIRGASLLLDQFNREDMSARLRAALPGAETVFAAGGSAVHVVDADRETIEAAGRSLRAEVRRRTGDGLDLFWGVGALEGATGFRGALAAAFRDLHRRRGAPPAARADAEPPFVRRCVSCGAEPAELGCSEPARDGGGFEWLGPACRARRDAAAAGRQHGVSAWARALGADRDDAEERRARDFHEIGEAAGRRSGYIGVLYADGDGMGRRLQRIESAAAYGSFAGALDEAIAAAVRGALRATMPEFDEGERIPADVLVLGGDDVVAVVPADRAIRFGLELMRGFEQEARGREPLARSGDDPPSVSVGIAIARQDQPFREVVGICEELLRSAKRRAGAGHGGIDVADISQTRLRPIDQVREELSVKNAPEPYRLGTSPWTADELARLQGLFGALEREFGTTRLRRLLSFVRLGPRAAAFEIARLVGRLDGSQACRVLDALDELGIGRTADLLGWSRTGEEGGVAWQTPLADLEQLWVGWPLSGNGKATEGAR